jgi:hypothetical protein
VSRPETALSELLIFPNPAGNHLNFELEMAGSGNCVIEILDAAGRTVLRRICNGKESGHLDISSLSPGLYQMLVSGSGSQLSKRFSKY